MNPLSRPSSALSGTTAVNSDYGQNSTVSQRNATSTMAAQSGRSLLQAGQQATTPPGVAQQGDSNATLRMLAEGGSRVAEYALAQRGEPLETPTPTPTPSAPVRGSAMAAYALSRLAPGDSYPMISRSQLESMANGRQYQTAPAPARVQSEANQDAKPEASNP